MNRIIFFLVILTSCAHTQFKPVKGRMCDGRKFVTADQWDSPEFKKMAHAGTVVWNGYIGKDILWWEPTLVTDIPRQPWITVSVATTEDMENWDDNDCGRVIIHRRSNRCIGGATIRIKTNSTTNRSILNCVFHELGHAIGLDHSREPDTIMYPYDSVSPIFKPGHDTLRELRRLYGENNVGL